MRKTRRSTTRRRQTKRGGKFQMKVQNNCNNAGGKTRINAWNEAVGADEPKCLKKGACWKPGSGPWCYKPFSNKFNIIIKK